MSEPVPVAVWGPYRDRKRWQVVLMLSDGRRQGKGFRTKEAADEAWRRWNSDVGEREIANTEASLLISQAVRFDESNLTWVYFLKLSGEVVYVGVTNQVQDRMQSHRDAGVEFDSLWIVPTPFPREQALRVERALVRLLNPPLNFALKPRHKHLAATR